MAERDGPPYLSIVATSRNDDHGGDLLRRMQLFVDGLDYQMARVGLPSELVLVEWNPPPDRPPLADALRWPKSGRPLAIRIVTVPHERHARLKHSDALPLFQMIGKNVGIRRARGGFVLCTNVDVLISDSLADFLGMRQLQPGCSYRVDRCDVPASIQDFQETAEALDWCEANMFRIARPSGVFSTDGAPWRGGRMLPRRRHPLRSLAYRWNRIREIRRHGLAASHNVADDPQLRPLLGPLEPPPAGYLSALRHTWRNRMRARSLPSFHALACGDFTLLSAQDWSRLRGYPEFELYSWHLDSLLLGLAAHRGIEEHRLAPPAVIYHVEQSVGSAWTPEGENALFQRLESSGVPRLSDHDFMAMVAHMRDQPADFTLGPPNWGLSDVDLPETLVV